MSRLALSNLWVPLSCSIIATLQIKATMHEQGLQNVWGASDYLSTPAVFAMCPWAGHGISLVIRSSRIQKTSSPGIPD